MAAASIGQVHRRALDAGTGDRRCNIPACGLASPATWTTSPPLLRVSGLLPKSSSTSRRCSPRPSASSTGDRLPPRGLDPRRPARRAPDFAACPASWRSTADILAMSRSTASRWNRHDRRPRPGDRVMAQLIGFRSASCVSAVPPDPDRPQLRQLPLRRRQRRLALLDFGATRFAEPVVAAYRRLMAGTVRGDRAAMGEAAQAIGAISGRHPSAAQARRRDRPLRHRLRAAAPPWRLRLRRQRPALRLRDAGLKLSMERLPAPASRRALPAPQARRPVALAALDDGCASAAPWST